MHIIKFTSIATLFVAATTAIPSFAPPNAPPQGNYAHAVAGMTEPDLRFVNYTLSHPHAEIHVSHPKDKRDGAVYGIYECSKPFFKGTCHWTQIQPNERATCHNRLYGPVGSVGPDRGVTCTVYSASDCKESDDWKSGFTYPGSGDCPNDKWLNANDLISCPRSWRCEVTA